MTLSKLALSLARSNQMALGRTSFVRLTNKRLLLLLRVFWGAVRRAWNGKEKQLVCVAVAVCKIYYSYSWTYLIRWDGLDNVCSRSEKARAFSENEGLEAEDESAYAEELGKKSEDAVTDNVNCQYE